MSHAQLSEILRGIGDRDSDWMDAVRGGLGDLPVDQWGALFEAWRSRVNGDGRRSRGLYVTPWDAATFIAAQAPRSTRSGSWVDPCCGTGTLALLLSILHPDGPRFVADQLVLGDIDEIALETALHLLTNVFSLDAGQARRLRSRSVVGDAMTATYGADHAIINPPYAATDEGWTYEDFLIRFWERHEHVLAVTPATWMYSASTRVRDVAATRDGDAFVFDNMPSSLFVGYKFGSSNTNTKNSVRASVTSSSPGDGSWRTTPWIRWTSANRREMFDRAPSLLVDTDAASFHKPMPETAALYERLRSASRIGDLVVKTGPYRLTVASTPRYYVSASRRSLDRSNKIELCFETQADADLAYVVLNSSLPYWWWRTSSGGLILSRATLLDTPFPETRIDPGLIEMIAESEARSLVTKSNAGRLAENIKHSDSVVAAIDEALGLDHAMFASSVANDITTIHRP